MKKNQNILFFILMIAGAFFMPACNPDECKDVDCGDNGICIEGTCECDAGYEGTNCEIVTADKLVGLWDATDVCSPSGTQSYDATISKSSNNAVTIIINNFSGVATSFNINATITGPNNFTIPSQTVGGASLSGSGTISQDGKTITVSYKITLSGAPEDTCNGTWVKK